MADRHLGDVLYKDRHAVCLRKQDVFDVRDLVTLGQVGGAAAVHETDAADVHRLLAHVDRAAAHIDIGVADGADHLGQSDVVGVEFVQIDLDVIFLRGPAPGVELHHAGHRQESPLQYPVLNGPQIGQSKMLRSGHLIAVDFTDQAGGLDLRGDVIRQTDVLLEVDGGLRQREIVVDAVIEGHAHE